MIVANITTYRGLDSSAVHYYCEYADMPEPYEPKKDVSISNRIDLMREIKTQKDADNLNRIDGYAHFRIGKMTNRFDTIEDIHQELLNQFSGKNIISYYEREIFKNMLYIVDGKNLGFDYFGEVFTYVPSSCYRDLVPEVYTIKCVFCGVRYLLQDVTVEKEWNGKKLIQFKRPRHFAHKCCDDVELVWNVVFERG